MAQGTRKAWQAMSGTFAPALYNILQTKPACRLLARAGCCQHELSCRIYLHVNFYGALLEVVTHAHTLHKAVQHNCLS
jgi:hypothetical protein